MRWLAATALAMLVACAHPAPDAGGNIQREIHAPALVGVWRVVKFCGVDTLGKFYEPFGVNPNGLFVYSRSGELSIQISRATYAPPAANGDDALTAEALQAQRVGYMGYYGSYTVVTDSIVIHHVAGGTVPSYVGTDQRRVYRIRGDTLTIGGSPQTWPCRVMLRVRSP